MAMAGSCLRELGAAVEDDDWQLPLRAL